MTLADAFEAERPRLVRLAYATLGSVAEAEDVVQDAWLRLQGRDRLRGLTWSATSTLGVRSTQPWLRAAVGALDARRVTARSRRDAARARGPLPRRAHRVRAPRRVRALVRRGRRRRRAHAAGLAATRLAREAPRPGRPPALCHDDADEQREVVAAFAAAVAAATPAQRAARSLDGFAPRRRRTPQPRRPRTARPIAGVRAPAPRGASAARSSDVNGAPGAAAARGRRLHGDRVRRRRRADHRHRHRANTGPAGQVPLRVRPGGEPASSRA